MIGYLGARGVVALRSIAAVARLLTVAVDDYHGLSAKQPCGTVRDTFGVERAVCTDKVEEMTAACKDCGKR